MSHMDRELRAQFFLTGSRPCPYLPGRLERKLFTTLQGSQASVVHDHLSAVGFRRSQNIAYRPACEGCQACVSVRVYAEDFQPNRSQRRIIKRNADLVATSVQATATDEQYALFQAYLAARHAEGGMHDMDAADYTAMIEETPVDTALIEYRLFDAATEHSKLVACCITDTLNDGLSLVYSFFDPILAKQRSLGRAVILDHIIRAKKMALPYVYLGYWVSGSDKMDYKIDFQPIQALTEKGWCSLDV